MNTSIDRNWEVRLGAVHVVILIGLITGSLAGAFYLGFSSGQNVGFEAAQMAALTNVPKIPIPAAELDEPSVDDNASDVYAKLASGDKESRKDESNQAMPEIGAIKDAEVAPVAIEAQKNTKEELVKNAESVTVPSANVALQKNETEGQTLGAVAKAAEVKVDTKRTDESVKTVSSVNLNSEKQESAHEEHKLTETKAALTKEEHSQVKTVETAVKAEAPKNTINDKKLPSINAEGRSVVEVKAEKNEKNEKNEEPKVEVKKEPNFIHTNIPQGWYVQVAAPRKMQEANDMAAQLKKSGFNVMIEAARVRGEEYFRIIVGPESQRVGAEKIMGQIKRESSVKGDPFVRAVKK